MVRNAMTFTFMLPEVTHTALQDPVTSSKMYTTYFYIVSFFFLIEWFNPSTILGEIAMQIITLT